MNGRDFIKALLMCVVLACLVTPVSAQPQPPAVASADTPPPLPPGAKSPVSFFRGLLKMNDAEREQALTNRPPEVRERLLAKVREYQALPPLPRELRLRMTELRWWLVPLMRTAPAQRLTAITNVPPHLRQPITDRLERWDLLPPGAQQEVLTNELALDYFTQAPGPAPQEQELLGSLTPAQRQVLEADIERWQAMSAGERRRLFDRVNRFFDLPPEEQERALNTLSHDERAQMEATLDAFEKLPRGERGQCLRAFAEFAGMKAAERQQFLEKVKRWSAMSPGERDSWRDLVQKLPELPPMPPGFLEASLPPMPEPPMPTVATNSR